MNDIVCAGSVKLLVAGVQIIPHAIFTEQPIKLSAGQLLCIFVLLGTKYHEFSLLCHVDAPQKYSLSLHIGKFDFPRLFFLFQKRRRIHVFSELLIDIEHVAVYFNGDMLDRILPFGIVIGVGCQIEGNSFFI